MKPLIPFILFLILILVPHTFSQGNTQQLNDVANIDDLSVSSTIDSARIDCDSANRPDIESCYDDEYDPVCGYYQSIDNCPFEICGSPHSSPCYACANETIAYYSLGECNQAQTVNYCYSDICDVDLNPGAYWLTDSYQPTCGYTRKCYDPLQGDCARTYPSVCESCKHRDYAFYQDGPCEKDKNYCNAASRDVANCPSTTNPVCATYTDESSNTHYVTVDNSCKACKEANVSYYTSGACGTPPVNNQTYCLPNSRPTSCEQTENPVCGFYMDSDSLFQHKIVDNECLACKDTTIVYHTPGPCIFYCDRNPFVIYECAGSLLPICATYTENGATKKVSLRNSCLGCYGYSYNVASYVDGLCPGDDGILCANNGGAFAEGMLDPVCGLTSLDCTSNSCRKTYADPYTACQSEEVVKYTPGPCPGDYGVACDEFRNGDAGMFTYGPVCAYTQNQCNSNNCKDDYEDHMEACNVEDVLYFTKGPC